MTLPELPLSLPPVDVVRQLGDLLETGVPRLILDAGAGTGRNARYLEGLGHAVVRLGNNANELQASSRLDSSLSATVRSSDAVVGDVCNLPFKTVFDVVLMNEVAHLLPNKQSVHRAIADLCRVTKQGGLNVVSGYLALPGLANIKNTSRNFHSGELRDIYRHHGWDVRLYKEQILPNQYIGQGAAQREIISSRSMIIAQRPY